MQRNKKMYIILSVLIVFVVVLSVAYATLSTQLNITVASTKQAKQAWNVGFVANNSISATVSGTSDTGRSCSTISATTSTVTVGNIQLSKPEDKCTWPLTIKNNGTIAANLKQVNITAPTGITCTSLDTRYAVANCGNIKYLITTDADGSNTLPYNTVINAGASLQVYLSARYNSDTLTSTEIVHSGLKFALVFEQK